MMEKQLVPQLRFPEFKGVWEKNKIGDVSRIYGRIGYRGYTVQDIVEKGEGAITLSPSNFIDNHIDISKSTYISWDKYEESPEIKIYNRDILFVKTGSTFGKTAFVKNLNEPATINPQIVVLKDIDIHNEFLGYVISLPQIRKQVESIVVGGAIPTMSQKELSKMIFSVPSLPEQQKIASFLTDVDAKITKLSKKKDLLEQYKKGVMQKIFSQALRFKDDNGNEFPKWEYKKLGSICKLQGGYAFKSNQFKKQGIPVIRISNISNDDNYIDSSNLVYYHDIEISDNYILSENDLIVAMSGATTGKSSIYSLKVKGYVNQRVGVFRPKKSLLNKFLIQFVFSNEFIKQLDKVLVAGAQPNISSKDIEDFDIPLPTLNEQTKIADFLTDIDLKIKSLSAKIENSKTFKKGLLQKMFV